ETASLSDGEAMDAAVTPELVTRIVDDASWTEERRRAPARDEPGRVAVGHEADLHALGLGGDRKPEPRRLGAHLGLRQLADGEERPRELLVPESEEEVRLVLRCVDGGAETEPSGLRIGRDARVVAGREPRRAELAGAAPEEPELHVLVAARARIRRPPGQVLCHEGPHDVALEGIGHV